MDVHDLIDQLRTRRYILEKLRSNEVLFGILLSVVVGVGAGFGAILFWRLVEFGSLFFFKGGATTFATLGKYYVIILPALGGLIIGPILYFFAREAKGEGPPEVMEAVALRGGRIRKRVVPVKVLVSAICIGSGGSVGREGPIVQFGAAVGSTIGQWFKVPEEWLKTLVLCGVAGGISATFNAPLAGIIFAIEIISRRFATHNFGYIVISSVSANVIARIFLFTKEHPTAFTVRPYEIVTHRELAAYVVLGIITGFIAIGFMRFFFGVDDFFKRLKMPEYLKPVLGGLVVGAIGLYYPQVFGVGYGSSYGPGGILMGYGAVDQALTGQMALATLAAVFLLKMVATSVTLGSGGSGGIFAPSLFIGAMLGGAFGMVVHNLFPTATASSGAYALVGMGAFFATMVRGPVTAIIMLFELTLDYALMLPVMTTVVISTIIARRFTPHSVYTFRLLKRGIDIHQLVQASPLKGVTVAQVMTQNYPTVQPTTSVNTLVERLRQTGHHGFPVVDAKGELQGIVTLNDVASRLTDNRNPEEVTVNEISTKSLVVAYPDQSLHEVLVQVGARELGRIPVVERDNPKRLLGVLRRPDVIRAYTRALAQAAKEQV